MKYFYLLILFLGNYPSGAQYLLSGTEYHQHFDSLHLGLPAGWSTDTNAGFLRSGGMAAFTAVPGTGTRWTNASAGFKNVASANSFSSFASATNVLQLAAADRALGLRQTGSFGDPGAAFSFLVDNTYGLSDFRIGFKLQSLDSGGSRNSRWLLQYGIGYRPDTFITVATGMLSTGNNTFANTPVSASFGTALDSLRVPVCIRLASLEVSSGAGSRTTTAIDDVVLRWSGTADSSYRPLAIDYEPFPGTAVLPAISSLAIRFNRQINPGSSGNFYIGNETDHTQQVLPAAAASSAGNRLIIPGVLLSAGKHYHVTYDATIADTGGIFTPALEDTTVWRFKVRDPAGLGEMPPEPPPLKAFLFPDRLRLQLDMIMAADYKLLLFNDLGQCVYQNTLVLPAGKQAVDIGLPGLKPGWYMLSLECPAHRWRQKCLIR